MNVIFSKLKELVLSPQDKVRSLSLLDLPRREGGLGGEDLRPNLRPFILKVPFHIFSLEPNIGRRNTRAMTGISQAIKGKKPWGAKPAGDKKGGGQGCPPTVPGGAERRRPPRPKAEAPTAGEGREARQRPKF